MPGMERQKAKTAITVVAITILLLGAYVASYVTTIKIVDTTTATDGTPFRWRLIDSRWQYTVFAPAIWVESKVLGIPVEPEFHGDLEYLRHDR